MSAAAVSRQARKPRASRRSGEGERRRPGAERGARRASRVREEGAERAAGSQRPGAAGQAPAQLLAEGGSASPHIPRLRFVPRWRLSCCPGEDKSLLALRRQEEPRPTPPAPARSAAQAPPPPGPQRTRTSSSDPAPQPPARSAECRGVGSFFCVKGTHPLLPGQSPHPVHHCLPTPPNLLEPRSQRKVVKGSVLLTETGEGRSARHGAQLELTTVSGQVESLGPGGNPMSREDLWAGGEASARVGRWANGVHPRQAPAVSKMPWRRAGTRRLGRGRPFWAGSQLGAEGGAKVVPVAR
ncbi:PREDICTED: gametogenetin-like [Elephantulus edwardii]|uniref:gametogenetin-like n=1 Tax=Elephantulus edwardii TaxID=28737 RepID=UPI0003F0E583|nr:PREDICTED: gametogenetin-like [Elephantulus edwardii]